MDIPDHDLLIRMDEKLSLIHTGYLSHIALDATAFAEVNKDIKTISKRIDWVVTGALITVLLFIVSTTTLIANSVKNSQQQAKEQHATA